MMPTVTVHEVIDSPIERVWDKVIDVEAYPTFMQAVQSIEVVDSDGDESTVQWTALLKGSVLKWTEREKRDHDAHRITYWQLDGDLEAFDGYWQLTALDDGRTDAYLTVRFEVGIPILAEMLNPVAKRAIEQNSRAMLQSLSTVS